MKTYFDITTTMSWGGAQVGITRVEREIAKRATRYSGYPVAHCFYHASTRSYYVLTREFAHAVLELGWWIEREVAKNLPVLNLRDNKKFPYPSLGQHNPGNANLIRFLNDRSANFTLTEVLSYRDNNPFVPVNTPTGVAFLTVDRIVEGVLPLNDQAWIVNGGLDWEYKDLREIRLLKERYEFNYVAILYDLIPLLFPHYVVPFYVDLLKRYFGELFWTADFVLCISSATRSDVQKHLSDWRMPDLPLSDWQLGSDLPSSLEPTPLPKTLRGRPFLLYVSTIEPRKSHRTIVEAFERAVIDGRVSAEAACVFVGRVGWNSDNLIQEIQNNPSLQDRIILMSGISDDELLELYKHARFVVFPSRYEGYGLSLVEAMALGKACISGDAGSLKEVGRDAPLYIDPIDIPAWSSAISTAFSDDEMVASLSLASRTRYEPVTWDQSAAQFFDRLDRHIEAST